MQVATTNRRQPPNRAAPAQFFLSPEHERDDLALGHAHLSTVRAQRAFRAAGVERVWLMGRAPEIQAGKIPARVVGILAAEDTPALLLEHIEGLERVLRSVCGTPVKVHCYFLPSGVPTSAIPVAVRDAGGRPRLPVPAALSALLSQASANDSPVEVAPDAPFTSRARPALLRAAGLHY